MLGWFTPTVFLGPAQRRLFDRGVPLFAFHKIAFPPQSTRDPFLYDAPPRFEAQLGALRAKGYVSGTISEALISTENPQRKVVITFDDGCRNVLENGREILARHGFHAIQFLVAGLLGQRNEWDVSKGDAPEDLMTEDEVREWLAAGHEIGSHSMTHRNLRKLSQAEAREEISASKKRLEDKFGISIRHFSYPFGSWNPPVRDLVIEAGYESASTMDFGVNSRQTPARELRRLFALTSFDLLRKAIHRARRRLG